MKIYIKEYIWYWSALGAIVSATAIISIIQGQVNIDLLELPTKYIEYYRNLAKLLVGWIPLPFNIVIAQWYADLMTIALMILITIGRANKIYPLTITPVFEDEKKMSIGFFIYACIFTFLIILLVPLAFAYICFLLYRINMYSKPMWANYPTIMRGTKLPIDETAKHQARAFYILLIISIISTVIFFVLSIK
ncbi:MAG: hypothetical protein L3J98_15535 [Gammaproteobacteria bacterium]|nr:hypothetical protein [Gammaproteobacteria bacterium]MCF6261549.1 hypothetical protein [Gammaproteobacteria bacterium]